MSEQPILPEIIRSDSITIGVLALQGAFSEHLNHLLRLSNSSFASTSFQINPILVKTSSDLIHCSALIIPGGESTTINLLASNQIDSSIIHPNQSRFNFMDWLKVFVRSSRPLFGTCAGLILLSDEVYSINSKRSDPTQSTTLHREQISLGGLPIKTIRNQYGNQLNSFEQSIQIPCLSNPETPFPVVFIRAPIIHTIINKSNHQEAQVNELVKLPNLSSQTENEQKNHLGQDHQVIGLSFKNILATSFHPELTSDLRFHLYWISNFVIKSWESS